MRVVEPDVSAPKQVQNKHKKRRKKTLRSLFILAVLSMGAILVLVHLQNTDDSYQEDDPTLQLVLSTDDTSEPQDTSASKLDIKNTDFQSVWYSILTPDAQLLTVAPDLDNDTEFSRMVMSRAEARGYRLQKVYTGENLTTFRGIELAKDVVEPLEGLIAAARDDGLNLSIYSAYRSMAEQEDIFVGRYKARVAAGASMSEAIESVLEGAAPPGYSKHHSAFTVDMTCNGAGAESFIGTACDEWLSAENYLKARQYGFIPSYPHEVDVQGPIPEPWEYNYVGVDTLIDLGML